MYQSTVDESQNTPCPVCQGTNFEWGRLHQAYYRSGLPGSIQFRFTFGSVIKMRRCLTCNNLLMFIDEQGTKSLQRIIVFAVIIAVTLAIIAIMISNNMQPPLR